MSKRGPNDEREAITLHGATEKARVVSSKICNLFLLMMMMNYVLDWDNLMPNH